MIWPHKQRAESPSLTWSLTLTWWLTATATATRSNLEPALPIREHAQLSASGRVPMRDRVGHYRAGDRLKGASWARGFARPTSARSPFGSPQRSRGSRQGFRGRCGPTFRDCPWFSNGVCCRARRHSRPGRRARGSTSSGDGTPRTGGRHVDQDVPLTASSPSPSPSPSTTTSTSTITSTLSGGSMSVELVAGPICQKAPHQLPTNGQTNTCSNAKMSSSSCRVLVVIHGSLELRFPPK